MGAIINFKRGSVHIDNPSYHRSIEPKNIKLVAYSHPDYSTELGISNLDYSDSDKELKEKLYRIRIEFEDINGTRKISALVDTGSMVDVVSEKIVKEAGLKFDKAAGQCVTGKKGAHVAIIGEFMIPVKLGKEQYETKIMFKVIKELSQEMIIGLPTIVKEKFTINIGEQIINCEKNDSIITMEPNI